MQSEKTLSPGEGIGEERCVDEEKSALVYSYSCNFDSILVYWIDGIAYNSTSLWWLGSIWLDSILRIYNSITFVNGGVALHRIERTEN